ncbi:MAG: winged helix-turn-helix transcriptional regulator [Euryarchaeota archaeon]|nr:winged helix-turn-helix transcriptional regulator [Euryarchaeota archaeon]
MDAGEHLDLENRRRVFVRVRSHPGEHLRELQRALEMPMGLLNHHLNYLEERGIISSRMDRYYKRYYPSEMGAREKTYLSALRQERPRSIVLHLVLNPGSSHRALLENFGLSPSTLSFYLRDLEAKGVVIRERSGRESLYSVGPVDEVVRILITHRPSFLDTVVDRFLEVWFEKKGT